MRINKRIIIAYLYQIGGREIHIEKLAEKLKGEYSEEAWEKVRNSLGNPNQIQ